MLFLLPGSCTFGPTHNAREAAVSWEKTAVASVGDEEPIMTLTRLYALLGSP
jgi:hypothetical protein